MIIVVAFDDISFIFDVAVNTTLEIFDKMATILEYYHFANAKMEIRVWFWYSYRILRFVYVSLLRTVVMRLPSSPSYNERDFVFIRTFFVLYTISITNVCKR